MNETKTIFLDVDGTLVADKGEVPASAIQAIHQAQANGHKVILCTGRAMPELYQPILDIGFDGIVACGGNYVLAHNDEVLREHFMSQEDVRTLLEYFDEHHIEYYLETNSGLYTSKGCDAQLLRIQNHLLREKENPGLKASMDQFRAHLIHNAQLLRDDVTKISFLGSEHSIEMIKEKFSDRFEIFDLIVPLFGKNSGEIALKGTDKTVGMQILMDYYGYDQAHTVAMGDGNNDISMLKYVGYGVALGNATDQLKAVSDFVSKDVNDDGLAYAFKHLHLSE
jgi:Cof subfamily protein (haloacid dehalogenase superfamily)